MYRVLTAEAKEERAEFVSEYGRDGSCCCHISPPCSSCTHPGNPMNQEEDDSCWEPEEKPAPQIDVMKSIRDLLR
jgi:hypothetical protein